MGWLRLSFRLQALISIPWAADRLYRLWFASPRFHEPRREKQWRESSKQFFVPWKEGPLAVYQWGEAAETVLLLHGWSGRGPQMGAFVAPLLEAGYQVLAFDAPGHGRSPGNSSSIFRMNDALQAVCAELGPIRAVVAHSFGVMLLAYALRHAKFQTQRAVCISSPTTPIYLVDLFCRYLAIDEKLKQAFMRRVEQRHMPDIWQQIAADENVRDLNTQGLNIPALIIHDENDVDVPLQYGKQLANAWPDSTLLVTQGLGHRRILRDQRVLEQVRDFIST